MAELTYFPDEKENECEDEVALDHEHPEGQEEGAHQDPRPADHRVSPRVSSLPKNIPFSLGRYCMFDTLFHFYDYMIFMIIYLNWGWKIVLYKNRKLLYLECSGEKHP